MLGEMGKVSITVTVSERVGKTEEKRGGGKEKMSKKENIKETNERLRQHCKFTFECIIIMITLST